MSAVKKNYNLVIGSKTAENLKKQLGSAVRTEERFAEKYLHKGTKVLITGRIQTGSYTNKDGQKVYTTDVVVEDCEFAESKNAGGSDGGNSGGFSSSSNSNSAGDGFMNIPDCIDEELPFN